MQKLVWQNANGDTLDLTSGSYGITEWEGFSNSSLNIQSQQVPFQDGAVFLDALIEPRELSVTLAMQDNNDLELRYQLRRELIHKLNPKLGEGYLVYTNDFISKRIKCVAQIPLFETHNSNDSGTPKASLSWVANEPYWEDLEETVVVISGLNTIQNNGDVSAQVEIIIPSGTTNPAIANRRNQKQIDILGTYNNIVRVDTNNGKKSVTEEVLDFTWVCGSNINDMVFVNGNYIYVGSQIIIENYLSGKKYIVNSGVNVELSSIIYANNLFVIVGADGTVLTSPDGKNWTQRTSGTNKALMCITYGNNLFVAVGVEGTIITSPDGITWTDRSIENFNILDITYANNLFVAVGDSTTDIGNNGIYTSPDGITWTGISVEGYLEAVTYGNNQFVICGLQESGAVVYTSPDGITWTQRTIDSAYELYDIIYANNLFVIVGDEGSIFTSSDGITWTQRTSEVNNSLRTIIYANRQFTISGDGGVILSSKKGIMWTTISIAINGGLRGITYYNNQYICVGANGLILASLDGKNWTQRNSPVNNNLMAVTYGNNLFVAVGYYGTIITSPDGITWTDRSLSTEAYLFYGIVYGNNLFVAVGNRIYTSPDGITWTQRINTLSLRAITYANNLFVAVGSSGRIYTSEDGITWTQRTSGINKQLNGITYEKELFVAVGNNGTILTSPDGITWISQSSGIDKYLYSVVFGNGQFVAVGENGSILVSVDGVNWIDKSLPTSLILFGITIGENVYKICGSNIDVLEYSSAGVIMESYISETLNLISDLTPDSDMTFNLEVGNNDILYSDDNGNGATLKFRQKYIGV